MNIVLIQLFVWIGLFKNIELNIASSISWLIIMIWMLFGKANKHTANDNTSGIITIIESAIKLPEDLRDEVCFVLFDNEELGLLGSSAFSKEYKEVAERMLELLPYGPDDPFAYDYNGACTAFAKGESAMYTIGSYAIPQIQTVNPDMEIDSFVMPASNNTEGNQLNSGIDLQFCVMKDCKNKEAAYEVLDFLLNDENVQAYLDDQKAVPCKEGDFELASTLDGMKKYIKEGKMSDFQDHYYPSEMAVDAQIQTFLMKKNPKAFLKKFDTDWVRYNRDIIRKVEDYEKSHNN